MNKGIFALLVFALTGCATPYQPQGERGGYSETQLAENVFKVSFDGNAYIGRETVSDYALLRSAEVVLEHGFKHFVVVADQNYATNSTFTTPTTTYGSAYAYGNYAHGSATTYGGQTYLLSKPLSSNVIICFKDKPDGFAFDAELVVRSLKKKYRMAE